MVAGPAGERQNTGPCIESTTHRRPQRPAVAGATVFDGASLRQHEATRALASPGYAACGTRRPGSSTSPAGSCGPAPSAPSRVAGERDSSRRSRRAANTAIRLMPTCTATNREPRPVLRATPASSGPAAETPVCSAAKMPNVVPTMPEGARLAVNGLRTGAYIVSPRAKTPYTPTNIAPASAGVKDAAASSSHENTQIEPTTTSSDGDERLAVHFITAICSATITRQLTAAAVPIVRSETPSTVIA